MFADQLSKFLQCPVCTDGIFEIDQTSTLKSYISPEVFSLDDLDSIVDGMIASHYVLTCSNCGHQCRYTLEELDKLARKAISRIALNLLSTKQVVYGDLSDKYFKVMVYCGGCSGFDGSGSCPFPIFNKCEVKKFPYVI